MRTQVVSLFLVISALSTSSLAASLFSVRDNNSQNLQTLLNEATQLLPTKLKNSFSSPIEVRFENLPENNIGMAKKSSVLVLNKNIVSEIEKGPALSTKTQRRHGSVYKEVLATILHETTHLYDNLNVHDASERSAISFCADMRSSDATTPISDQCFLYGNITQSVSQNPYFLEIAGWYSVNNKGMRTKENGFVRRSADIYELKNPQETLAVNMEYFLMDSQYKCRKPSLYRFLRNYFQHEPFKNISCDQDYYIINQTASNIDEVKYKIPFDQVYQIHYLWAAKGEAMMSRWGHAMIRIVMCDPKRTEVGPDCLKDTHYHLVLSYRAFTESLQISSIDGLNGKYPSRLFIHPMLHVIDEYNKGETRDLQSFPMNLSRLEMRQLLDRAFESHWTYDGKYYFLSNNCAVETLNLIKAGSLQPSLMASVSKTPSDLIDVLKRSKLISVPDFANRAKAIEDGYLFDSYKSRYEESIRVQNSPKAPTYDAYFKLDNSARQQLIAEAAQSADPKVRLKKLAGLTILENGLSRIQKMRLLEILAQQIIKPKTEMAQSLNGKAKEIQEIGALFSAPADLLSHSTDYGLPDETELDGAIPNAFKLVEHSKDLRGEIEKQKVDPAIEKLAFDLVQTDKNLLSLQTLLKQKNNN